MKDDLIKLKAGARRIADKDGNKMTMTVGILCEIYKVGVESVAEVVEELLDAGYLLPFGIRVLPTQRGYTDMALQRSSKNIYIKR